MINFFLKLFLLCRAFSLGTRMAQSKFEYTRKFETDDKLVCQVHTSTETLIKIVM